MSMSLTLISHVRPALAHITGLRHVAPSVRTHLPYSLPYINTQLSQSHNNKNNNNNVIKTSAITIKMEQESIDSVELRSRFIQTLLSRRTARGLNENPEFFDFDSCTNYIYFVHIFFLFLFQFRYQLRLQNLWPTLCFRIIPHALVRFRFFSLCFIYVF